MTLKREHWAFNSPIFWTSIVEKCLIITSFIIKSLFLQWCMLLLFFKIQKMAKVRLLIFFQCRGLHTKKVWNLPCSYFNLPCHRIIDVCHIPTSPSVFSFAWPTYANIYSVNLYHFMEEIKLHFYQYFCASSSKKHLYPLFI